MIAAGLCEIRFIGRKGTMVIGALITMAFFFAYTQVRNNAQNLGELVALLFVPYCRGAITRRGEVYD